MKTKKLILIIGLPILILSGIAAGLFIAEQQQINQANEKLSSLPPAAPPMQQPPQDSQSLPSGAGVLFKIEDSGDYYLISPSTSNLLTVYPLPGELEFGGRTRPVSLLQAEQTGGLSEVRALLSENAIKLSRQATMSAKNLQAAVSAFGRLTFDNPSPAGDTAAVSSPYFPAGTQSLTGYQAAIFFAVADENGRDAAAEALIGLLVSMGTEEKNFPKLLSMLDSNLMSSDRLNYMDYLRGLQAAGDFVRVVRLQTESDNGKTVLAENSLETLKNTFYLD